MRHMPALVAISLLLASRCALADDFPPGPGHDLVAKTCTQCHDASQVTSQRQGPAQWTQTVNEMIANGAQISQADFGTIVHYLAANFGPGGAATAK